MTEPAPAPAAVPVDDAIEVGVYASFAEGSDRGLVVLAMGRPYWLIEERGGFSLQVEPAAAASVREQLARFERESLRWPPAPIATPPAVARGAIADALLGVLVLIGCFRSELRWPRLAEAGALDAAKLFHEGELWRPATALVLHADARHLLANALMSLLVVTATIATFGRWRGWLLLPASAIAANVAAAALRLGEPYRSLGFSTAIFAGIGLLTGNAIRTAARSAHPHRWRAMFVPFAAGVTALALYGAGGLRVDVLAHACGFAAGLIAGGMIGAPAEPATQSLP